VCGVPGTQAMADTLPEASRYCTDGARVYPAAGALWAAWPDAAWHHASIAEEETRTSEGTNADLRTYLGRPKRRGRCFSRSLEEVREAARLLVRRYSRRWPVSDATPHYRAALPLLL
jgi:hypothetical protein